MWKQLYAILWASNDWLYIKLFLHVKIKRTDFDKQALRNRILVIRVIKERNVSLARIHPRQSPTFHHKCLNRPDSKSLELHIQCCQLSRIIREIPDSGPYLPVSRLESDISQIITKIAISCTLDFPNINFQIFCVVWATAGTLTFPDKILVCHCNLSNNVAKYELFMCYIRRSESTSIFGTNDVIFRVIWRHLSFRPYQFSLFDDVGGWQPCLFGK